MTDEEMSLIAAENGGVRVSMPNGYTCHATLLSWPHGSRARVRYLSGAERTVKKAQVSL